MRFELVNIFFLFEELIISFKVIKIRALHRAIYENALTTYKLQSFSADNKKYREIWSCLEADVNCVRTTRPL